MRIKAVKMAGNTLAVTVLEVETTENKASGGVKTREK